MIIMEGEEMKARASKDVNLLDGNDESGTSGLKQLINSSLCI